MIPGCNLRPLRANKIALALALLTAPMAHGATIHADNTLSSSCAPGYNISTRTCSNGSASAYRSLADAVAATQPGDTVLIRGGTYSERLVPPRSGNSSAYITIKNYSGETATLTGTTEPAIFLAGLSYLIIDGLRVDNVVGWGRIEDSNNNIIRNNRFSRATSTGTTGGLKLVRSTYNKILSNTFDDGNDSLVIQESDRNLVQDNTFTKGHHSLFSLRCGNYNVIRGNTFNNTDQKAGEIYDCEGTSDAPVKLNATKYNLVESNRFSYTRAASADYRYNGIQYSGQNGIVRRNVFYENQGGGLNFQVYSNEALYNSGHRVYNNTFFNNRCYAVAASGSSSSGQYFDNRVKNNIFYRNVGCNGESAQTNIGNTSAVILENNGMLSASPSFVNELKNDLRLNQGSSMIDAGTFATLTAGAGSGTQMTVDDAGYFFDGNGIPGEAGDLIQLSGQSQTARITAINYSAKTITLNQSLTWTDRQGVHLAYTGSRPDMGAYEYSTGSNTTPSAPANLKSAVKP
jgi:parallel beta-helix repeat protein